MGTPLDDVYRNFFARVDENMSGKESLVYAIFIIAISKARKNVRHSLSYTLTDDEKYEGYFTETLDDDEIDLLALHMLYECTRRKLQKLVAQRDDIGTPDFNRLPGKKEQLAVVESAMKTTKDDIISLTNEFFY
jgi:hypothetical protein